MSQQSLRILCFGDSLTAGFHDFGMSFHPYSIAFTAALKAALPHMAITVHHSGKNGDVGAWTAFHERLKQELPPENMYEAFQLNWAVPLNKGSKVLALTVPDAKPILAWVVEDRNQINELIRNHKQRNFYTFDLYSKIPYHSLSEQDRERYWDDGLHLTAQGYDWMGEHIAVGFLAAFAMSQQERAAAAPGPSRRGPALTRDEGPLEEEGGDPRVLSEGYVVVRRKDLD
ncbi:hypothetical protein E4U42_002932 [Claviceps africana]|uniref:SGNH hydrolase-type esterase domain-containing protein n=1 Tax=Claviceps africana TaxID=83212 RepID=A0A8K0JA29_9HYPO|nr:hypothetical protein E4U42_002932 [Claviceps africana]